MSETGRPAYQRSFAGMTGALILLLLVLLAWVGFRALTSDHNPTPITSLTGTELQTRARGARADGRLLVLLPRPVPAGWRVRAADYDTGADPHWHLAMLTDKGRYVGVEESLGSEKDLVGQYVDSDATRGRDVQIAGRTWSAWSDRGGDHAFATTIASPKGEREHVLVVGTAGVDVLREVAARLAGG